MFKKHFVGIAGLAFCLLFAGVGIGLIALRGLEFEDWHTPLGRLMVYLARLATTPDSATRVTPELKALAHSLILWAAVANACAFAGLLWLRAEAAQRFAGARGSVLLALQLLLAVAGDTALLFVLAAELAVLLPLRRGLAWMGALSLSFVLVMVTCQVMPAVSGNAAFGAALMLVCAQLLVFWIMYGFIYAARRERRRRLHLAAANADLRATQLLLGDMVRASERLRVSHDLHDIIGHHLTALNLHLDLAARQSTAQASGALATSQELARSLLAEVRAVVSAERQDRVVDLRRALKTLCDGIPAPAVQLDFPATLDIGAPLLVHTVFCCVQEAISNAVRHSAAQTVTVTLAADAGLLSVTIADDGWGNAQPVQGNGLRGMRERLEALGGELHAGNRAPRGFCVRFTLPLKDAAA